MVLSRLGARAVAIVHDCPGSLRPVATAPSCLFVLVNAVMLIRVGLGLGHADLEWGCFESHSGIVWLKAIAELFYAICNTRTIPKLELGNCKCSTTHHFVPFKNFVLHAHGALNWRSILMSACKSPRS